MKFFYKLILLCCLLFTNFVNAQTTVQIGSGTVVPANTLYGPLYRFSATSTTTGSRANIVFTQTELAAVGIVNGSIISEVQFNKTNVANFVTPATSYKMYMANTSNTTLATTLTWASILTTHTEVFTSSSFNIPSAAGWVSWAITPFTYTGGSLEIAFECSMGGNGAATDAFKWEYTDGFADKLVGVATSTGATLNGTVVGYKHRPNIKIVFTSNACTTPPTPGTATSTATNICANSSFTLGLTGNSVGSGQTYQWQSSPTGSAPWTNVGTSTTSPSFITSQASTSFYRCAVTCSGNTQNSTNIQVTSPALLSGIFTINSGMPTAGTNFQTFTDAINYMSCGISGPVTFNVLPGSGPYSEQVTIPQIFGASNTNRITFNGNDAVIQFDPVTANRHVIKLDNADYVTLDNLQIRTIGTTSTSFGWGIHLTNGSDYDSISRCKINIGSTSTTESNSAGIVVSGSSTSVATAGSASFNVIRNNTIDSAYNGIIISGTATSLNAKQNVITNNIIRDFYANGISMSNTDSTIVSFNDISRERRTAVTTFSGVELATGNIKCIVNGNKIHDTHNSAITQTGTAYGISSVSNDATTGVENRVTNNLVYNMNSASGTAYGLYNSSSDGVLYYHNTVVLNNAASTAGTTAGFYQTTAATGIALRNNIFSISRGGTGIKRCLQFITNTSTITSNNNLLYMNVPAGTDNKIGQWGAAASSFTTLADWKTANSNAYDQLSLDIDPLFTNASGADFKPTSSTLDGKGTPVGVLKDIVDSTRSLTTPDIGAYEYSTITVGLNFGAVSLVSPATVTSGCYSSSETVTIQIKNSSANVHNFVTNPVTVTVNVTGAVTQTLTTVVNTGTLASDATLNVVLPGSLNMSTAGVYTFNANTTLTGDVNTANDAIIATTRTKIVLAAGTAAASPTTFCAIGGTLPTLSSVGLTGASSLQWQESNTTNTGFTNITGATTTNFGVTTALTQNLFYRLVATCAGTSVISTEATVSFSNPTILTTTPATRCGTGTVNLGATASVGANVNWYAAASGGTSLFAGNTFTTPSISTNTTYFVGAVGNNGTSQISSNGVPTVTTSTQNSGLLFDLYVPVTLNSIQVYSTAAGTVTVTLQNSGGTVLFTSSAQPIIASTLSLPQTVNLGWNLSAGTGYRILVSNTGNALGYATGSFPAPLGNGVGFITNGATATGTTTLNYFVYNMNTSSGCESTRTPVIATIDNNPACGTLPVTITNFKGDKLSNTNKLSWTTVSEVNNKGFEIERSIDGTNFSSIGFIASAALMGNSSNALTYTFSDTKGFVSNSYYRLKQVDKDGKFAYSSIVLLKANKVKELTITQVYPNPTKAMLHVAIESPNNDKLTLLVTDITGKIVLQKLQSITMGNNILQLATNGLAAGSYFIKMVCANGCETLPIKFVKE